MPASGDEQPVSHGGMACRHGQDRGGKDCGYCLFAWTTQTRCPHTHSRRKSSSRKLLDLKDKGRRDHTLTSPIYRPSSWVHFTRISFLTIYPDCHLRIFGMALNRLNKDWGPSHPCHVSGNIYRISP